MLKLHRLELSGFKSFVDPVALDVHGGMTAIVGPNGCGKSNIADAVVWVLGERSAKSLRGEKMEDVIFAGAKNRKPTGMAEVTLELTSDNGFPKADDGRITIGRRVFRSGDSQYFLNGKSVRLKDVKDLLMDTGLGIRAYSMIEQGKIGVILSGKPQERRRLLEEAAGITRYRERRRLAELKLEEAKANLARLDDIVSEVERALRSLKRQANAAQRYQQRQEELRELQRQVLTSRWSRLQVGLAEFRGQIDDLVSREAGVTAELHREEAAQSEAREALEQESRELADRHGRVADLAATIEGKQEFLKGSRNRLQEIAERLAAGDDSAQQRSERAGEISRLHRDLLERRGQLVNDRQRAATDVDEDESRISQVEALVAEAESRLENTRTRLLSSINSLTALRNRLHREHVEKEKGELRRRHIADELERKTSELERTDRLREQTRTDLGRLQSTVESVQSAITEQRTSLAAVTRRREATRVAADEIGARIEELQRRRHVLKELEAKQEEHRSLIRDALEQAGLAGRPFLIDSVEVPEGWAATLDLFLGELEDAVLLGADDNALGVAQSLIEGPARGRLLRPHETGSFLHLRIDDEAVQSSLGEALGLPAELAAALPPAYLVDTPEDAQRLARANPGVAFLSRDRLWAQAGGIHFQGAKAKPGHLERGQEMQTLQNQLPPLQQELAALQRDLENLAAEEKSHQERIRNNETELAEHRERLAVAQARNTDVETQHHRLVAEQQTLTDELAEIDRELARLTVQLEQLSQQLKTSEEDHQAHESAFDGAQKEVERTREERESTRTSGASRRGRLEVLAERLEAHDQELARITREIEELDRQDELWKSESGRLTDRQSAIQESMDLAEQELQMALEARSRSEDTVIDQQQKLDAQRQALREIEARIETVRGARDELRGQIGEVRVSEAGLRQDAEHLVESFREIFHESPPEAPGSPAENLDELEVDLARKRDLLEKMGPVNLLAASEYEENSERLEFLTTQRTDVASSVERLRQTIREINQTSSERFRKTFDEVNEHFRKTFIDLFRGGEAEMRLLDEEDLLETPIEIVARPPGKRLQNLMLLSGGEKALTAIALLFALFKTKPSPFCILDEVDAPLDDVNTLRFVELLKKLSTDTQFVVITHNKLTMEAANLLYGVTMQERGVSSLVSVELDQVQPTTPAEPATASA